MQTVINPYTKEVLAEVFGWQPQRRCPRTSALKSSIKRLR